MERKIVSVFVCGMAFCKYRYDKDMNLQMFVLSMVITPKYVDRFFSFK